MYRRGLRRAAALLLIGVLAGCAGGGLQHQSMLRGFNLLQHQNLGWDQPRAQQSLQRVARIGANAVVLIAFLEQDSPAALTVSRSGAVTMAQLKSAITHARHIGLKVILKPQMLVRGSWAGAITHAEPQQWQAWFASYSRQLIEYARFAAEQQVDAFVIGTELSGSVDRVNWPELIRQVRAVYGGTVTYAAHNLDGVRAFRYWQQLDAVSLTLYPSLGDSGRRDEMLAHIEAAVHELEAAVRDIDRPLWVLEIGMPSARGASSQPWAWQHLKQAKVDLGLQQLALELWLQALDKPWVDGVFIWAWYSDDRAGGRQDTDYTPQHKPAETVIQRYWAL